MKKAIPVLLVIMVGIATHFALHPDIATVSSNFLAGQVAQGLVDPSPASPQVAHRPIRGDIPASTLLVAVISSVATLVYVGYTESDTFKRK